MKRTLLIIAIYLLILPAKAQDTLSLNSYLNYVVTYSQVLKQSQEALIGKEAQTAINKTGFLPQIDLQGQASLDLANLNNWQETIGLYRNHTYKAQVIATQPIYTGGTVSNKYKASKIEQDIACKNIELTLENILYQAESIYWNCSAAEKQMNAAQQYYQVIKKQFEIINIRFADGMIGKTDLLMITTRLKEAELQLSIAHKMALLALQNFNILMGKDPYTDNAVADSITQILPNPTPLSLEEVLKRRPDYLKGNMQVTLQKQYKKLNTSKFNPQIGISVAGGWGTDIPNLGYNEKFSGLAALNVTIPVFHWNERGKTNRLSNTQINIQKLEQEYLKDNIYKELCSAETGINQSSLQITITQENVSIAAENLSLITFSYNEGKAQLTDVLSAQISWITAVSNEISAFLNHKLALADYKRVIGSNEEKK